MQFRLESPSGKEETLSGEVLAHWEDPHYERLKSRMRAHGNAPAEEIVESGYIFDIVADDRGRWHFVRSQVEDIGLPDGGCEAGAPEFSTAKCFDSEEKLLDFMRSNLNPEDDYCPIRNLLGDWERFDLLNLWLSEMA